VATDNDGATKAASFTLTVRGNGGGGSDCAFGTPFQGTLGLMDKVSYEHCHVVGSGGPSMANFRKFTISWNPQYKALNQFAINTDNGTPDWYVEFKNTMTYKLDGTRPEVTLNNTGFTGLDGTYWVAPHNGNFAMVSKTKGYALYFSNNAQAPACSNRLASLVEGDALPVVLYPNPAKNTISIQHLPAGLQQVSVYNTLGAVVASKTVRGATHEVSLDISHLPRGTYYLKLNTTVGKGISRQFIKIE